MPNDIFNKYLSEINKAYLRGDATEHTHRPALKALIEGLAKKITATNEPKRTECGAPDYVVSRRTNGVDLNIGYIEAKDIATNLTQAAKTEQIKKRYLPSLNNFILTDYIEFRWYVNGEKQLTAKLAEESAGKFKATTDGEEKVRELFRSFLDQKPEKIKIAKKLAAKMGHKARMMRDIIKETFRQEEKSGILHGQFEAFKEVLLHDLTEEQFADMYAQTICYGLFSARCHIEGMTIFGKDKYAAFHGMNDRARELTREHAAYLLPKTNPFFRDIFGDIAGPKLDNRIVWLVDDLVELLKQADMGVILRDFARRKKRKDPVVHFYETFLAEYDAKLKKTRGVYYTPDEVVSYIVCSVDYLLKTKFGLKRGLADESKIKGKDLHKLLILDPAVGTGTFLFEVIDQIYGRFGRQKGMWSGYVKEHLLPRIFGFEIMMAPYAVAHMKLGLQLAETGYDFKSDERLGIYLTNTLEEAGETSRTLFAQWLSEEATAANKVKRDLPIMVVLGNPPYSKASYNQGNWIEKLMEDYKVNVRKEESQIQALSNDYIKFIRFAQWQIDKTKQGVVGFITGHGYIGGPQARDMRAFLINSFDEIFILNLHGSMRRAHKRAEGKRDEPVFQIMQGTSIIVACKIGKSEKSNKKAKVLYAEIFGRLREKLEYLKNNNISSTKWTKVLPKPPKFYFVPYGEEAQSVEEEFLAFKSVTEIYGTGDRKKDKEKLWATGFASQQDEFAISFDDEESESKIKRLVESNSVDELKKCYRLCATNQWKYDRAKNELREGKWRKNVSKCNYRPFDFRTTVYDRNVVTILRQRVMSQLKEVSNVALICSRVINDANFAHIFVSTKPVDKIFLSSKTSTNAYVFPLYLCVETDDGVGKQREFLENAQWDKSKGGRIPNLSSEYVEEFAKMVKLEFVSDGVGDLKKTFGPEDVFHYIYAVFHSPEYRRRYEEFLKTGFPRVPMPKGKVLFNKLCNVGEELTKLHLMEAPILEDDKKRPRFPLEGSSIVEKGYPNYVAHTDRPQKGKVYINKDQYFEGLRPEVWEFHIGGYKVCEKWLKDRRQRELSYEDISHYQKIVVALGETIRLMKQIDEVIDAHGGWPIK